MRMKLSAFAAFWKGSERTMMDVLGMRAIAEVSATRIVDCLLEGAAIFVVAALIARLSRRQGSSARFAIWFSALIAIGVSPLLSAVSRPHRGILEGAKAAALTVPGSWALCLFGLWAGIAGCLLLRIGFGLWRLRTFRKTLARVDVNQLDCRVRETLARYNEGRAVALCTSDRVRVPSAIGLIDPVIVLPTWAIKELSAEELSQVLLHELAHLRRRDDWTNLIQQVVKAVFFFHPAVWWIERNISLEREMACDDAVLAETLEPRAYAKCLTHVAEKSVVRRSLALAQAVLGRVRQTSLRVAQILDADRPVGKQAAWKTAAALVSFVAVCGLMVSREPQLVAFKDALPEQSSIASAASRNLISPNPILHGAAFKTMQGSEIAVQPKVTPLTTLHRKIAVAAGARVLQVDLRNSKVQDRAMKESALLRRASSQVEPAILTETVFMTVDQDGPVVRVQQIYEIQVWRFVVLTPASASRSEILHKEI
jgi:beta-lactamase regulating signal transducer with metallopeptidase domain